MTLDRGVVIVGANLAGGRAALALRAEGYDGPVRLVGDEDIPPYERPPLSKEALMGRADPGAATLCPDDRWEAEGIDLVLGRRATHLFTADGAVELDDGRSLPADRVILATGSRPRRLPVTDLPGIVHLRSAADVTALRSRLAPGAHVLVVGAGLIGTEVASSALHLGCTVTVVEACPLPMTRILGEDVASFVASLHRAAGVDLRTSTTILVVTPTLAGWRVELSDGTTLDAAAVAVGIGVEPATELALGAGLTVDNGIVVDERCRTSTPEVLAAGDVTNHPNRLLGVRLRLECFANAQDQGVTAAQAALGRAAVHERVPWGWSDQLGVNLQMAGVPALAQGWCRRGDLEAGSSIDLGLAGGRVVAAVGINRGRDVRRAMKLIEQGAVVDAGMVADDDVDLRSVTEAPVR